jgi:hypothetical protein
MLVGGVESPAGFFPAIFGGVGVEVLPKGDAGAARRGVESSDVGRRGGGVIVAPLSFGVPSGSILLGVGVPDVPRRGGVGVPGAAACAGGGVAEVPKRGGVGAPEFPARCGVAPPELPNRCGVPRVPKGPVSGLGVAAPGPPDGREPLCT